MNPNERFTCIIFLLLLLFSFSFSFCRAIIFFSLLRGCWTEGVCRYRVALNCTEVNWTTKKKNPAVTRKILSQGIKLYERYNIISRWHAGSSYCVHAYRKGRYSSLVTHSGGRGGGKPSFCSMCAVRLKNVIKNTGKKKQKNFLFLEKINIKWYRKEISRGDKN